MNARENFFRAVRRQNPETVPFALKLCPSQVEEFRRRTGSDDYLAYYGVPVHYVTLLPSRHPADYACYYRDLLVALPPDGRAADSPTPHSTPRTALVRTAPDAPPLRFAGRLSWQRHTADGTLTDAWSEANAPKGPDER